LSIDLTIRSDSTLSILMSNSSFLFQPLPLKIPRHDNSMATAAGASL
jgi:hypothetical protein